MLKPPTFLICSIASITAATAAVAQKLPSPEDRARISAAAQQVPAAGGGRVTYTPCDPTQKHDCDNAPSPTLLDNIKDAASSLLTDSTSHAPSRQPGYSAPFAGVDEAALITDETVPASGGSRVSNNPSLNVSSQGPVSPAQAQEAALITEAPPTEAPVTVPAPVENAHAGSYSSNSTTGSSLGDTLVTGLQNMAQSLSDSNPWNSPAAQAANAANARAAARAVQTRSRSPGAVVYDNSCNRPGGKSGC